MIFSLRLPLTTHHLIFDFLYILDLYKLDAKYNAKLLMHLDFLNGSHCDKGRIEV